MGLKIAINGFGRIGRSLTRVAAFQEDIEIVAINDITDLDMMLYLLKYDSVHGNLDTKISKIDEKTISINNNKIKIFNKADPKELDFGSLGVDVVFEATGIFLTQKEVQHHIDKGVKRVILTAPTKDEITPTFVIGVNEKEYNNQKIISNASCTTNCLAPIAMLLDRYFGIEKGLMTTIHSYTNDQNLLDSKHHGDIRRSRASAINMIPTSTGAAKAVDLVLPQLKGKLHGQSVRVPTPDVSMMDLNLVVSKKTSKDELSAIFQQASEDELKNILFLDKEKMVSQDILGLSYSTIVANDLLQVIDGDMIKIMAWYDNEWGYSNRLIEMAQYILKQER